MWHSVATATANTFAMPVHLQSDVPQIVLQPQFWAQVYKNKLEKWMLAEDLRDIVAYCLPGQSRIFISGVVDADASADALPKIVRRVPAILMLRNSKEQFEADVAAGLVSQLLQDIFRRRYGSDGAVSLAVVIYAFADLKRHKYDFVAGIVCMELSLSELCVTDAIPCESVPDHRALLESWLQRMPSHGDDAVALAADQQPLPAVLVDPTGSTAGSAVTELSLSIITLHALLHHHTGLLATDVDRPQKVFLFRGSPSRSLELSVRRLSVDNGRQPSVRNALHTFPETALPVRHADLSATFDRKKLIATSCELNLSLMRWRSMPELDLGRLRKLRVLILGCGTLGCNVMRLLLAWGLTRMTLVDYGDVSLSNPVRQGLFRMEDIGKEKAIAAKTRLEEIHPEAAIAAMKQSIPMPGHCSEARKTEEMADIRRLEDLIGGEEICDAVFLLTDSRESRWLPTLLCTAFGKPCFNAALGFQQYVAMMHHRNPELDGCYFCPDIASPGNSIADRTLDQQCTVTRPGMSYMASALIVEMMVEWLRERAAEEAQAGNQIRGHVADWSFSQEQLRGSRSAYCVACSENVLRAYRGGGAEWLQLAMQRPELLQDVCGIRQLLGPPSLRILEAGSLSADGSDGEASNTFLCRSEDILEMDDAE